jgi:hypothetical protein
MSSQRKMWCQKKQPLTTGTSRPSDGWLIPDCWSQTMEGDKTPTDLAPFSVFTLPFFPPFFLSFLPSFLPSSLLPSLPPSLPFLSTYLPLIFPSFPCFLLSSLPPSLFPFLLSSLTASFFLPSLFLPPSFPPFFLLAEHRGQHYQRG